MTGPEMAVAIMWMAAAAIGIIVGFDWWARRKDHRPSR
jgi:hypothetical protein